MKKISTYLFALSAAIAFVIAPGSTLLAAQTDNEIEASFKDSYVNRTYLKEDSVKAESKEGVVTLTGTVADESNKTLAQETAAGLPGVVRVDNQLKTKAQDAAESADTWMARKVKLALLFHRNVSGWQTSVDVKDSIVTLTGEASSEAQKQLTTEYAKDIDGVKDVRNQMTVAATPEAPERTAEQKLDDASITAMVKSALATHRSTSALQAEVITRDGEVTITGIAGNSAEKTLVGKRVEGIHGVVRVNNELTVK